MAEGMKLLKNGRWVVVGLSLSRRPLSVASFRHCFHHDFLEWCSLDALFFEATWFNRIVAGCSFYAAAITLERLIRSKRTALKRKCEYVSTIQQIR